MKMIIIFFALLFFSSSCFSQYYFPLEIGNRWDYSGFVENIQWQNYYYYNKKYEIVGDSTFANGENYFVFDKDFFWLSKFVRVDSSFIYFYDNYSQVEIPIFDLSANFNDSWSINWVQNSYTVTYLGNESIPFQNDWLETKAFNIDIAGVEGVTFNFSEKYGPLKLSDGIYMDFLQLEQISGCVISDTTYGILLPVKEQTFSPQNFKLFQNYPNPFNSETTIEYVLPYATKIDIALYNTKGQRVILFFSGRQSAGNHKVSFNSKNVSSGLYFIRLKTKDEVHTRKVTIIK